MEAQPEYYNIYCTFDIFHHCLMLKEYGDIKLLLVQHWFFSQRFSSTLTVSSASYPQVGPNAGGTVASGMKASAEKHRVRPQSVSSDRHSALPSGDGHDCYAGCMPSQTSVSMTRLLPSPVSQAPSLSLEWLTAIPLPALDPGSTASRVAMKRWSDTELRSTILLLSPYVVLCKR
ncbi:hypothetical protein P4O66_020261 [Electrophorus voltai]|uniref:Uncharacterized protein n=1 Tax=Electrophorus voltai TaxID=2609070 RepID=A0AAD8ZRS1_9TELE|nr:hypothetical protein P4O66_020261 [Electrophorus voltai]